MHICIGFIRISAVCAWAWTSVQVVRLSGEPHPRVATGSHKEGDNPWLNPPTRCKFAKLYKLARTLSLSRLLVLYSPS